MLVYPSLDYELNTKVRIHREANGYTQEEFAFLIGRDVADVIRYEDLTTTDAYDFSHINRYARVLILEKLTSDYSLDNLVCTTSPLQTAAFKSGEFGYKSLIFKGREETE